MTNGVKHNDTPTSSLFTVGVLLDSVGSYYNHRVIIDLIDAAEEQNIRLVFYFGGTLDNNKPAGTFSFVYTLPDKNAIQALIVFPHSVSPYSPKKTMKMILDQYDGIPIYSVFGYLPDYYSVWVDEAPEIEKMIRHLVEDHSYTKFALLCGPDTEESVSRERKNTILRVLESFGLTIKPDSMFSGFFTSSDGQVAARRILDMSDDSPETLICLNDQMAIGAIKEFQNNGVSIPEDIAVVGFDDVEENTTLAGPFTTINFPIWGMITAVMERIAGDLSGQTEYKNEKVELKAQFMHRESCGCTSYFEKKSQTDTSFIPLEQNRSSHSTLKRAAILRRSLEEVIEECIVTGDTSLFTDFIQQAIRTLARSGDLTTSFIDTFSTQWTLTLLQHQDFVSQVLINSLFVDAFRLLIQFKMKAFSRIHSNDLGSLAFYQSCNDLISQKISVYEAFKGIGVNLPQLGISRCQIVFICPDKPETGEVRLSYKEGLYTEIPEKEFIRFPLKNLMPSGIQSISNPIAVFTIVHSNTVYGYLLLSITEKHFEQFQMIQSLVSHIIDSAMLNDLLSHHIQALTQKNDALSQLSVIDEFTGLYNRRALYVTGRNMYQQALNNRESSCFIFLDMDGLKKINDTYGHQEGDAAILALANTLKKSFRENDLVVRYGGDEFVVLMIHVQKSGLQKTLDRISSEIDAFNNLKTHAWKLSTSWGYVFNEITSPQQSFDAIIEESDAKLYEEKRRKKAAAL